LTQPGQKSPVVVHVCTTCRAEGEPLEPREARAGARLFAALSAARSEDDPVVLPVECFGACRRPCALSFSAPGAWTYLCGDIFVEPTEILAAAKLYGASPEGVIPWKMRPDFLKKGVVGRLPPSPIQREP
jgi:predicted metal-binding protein